MTDPASPWHWNMNWTMPPALCVATGPQTSLVLEWELEIGILLEFFLRQKFPFLFLVSNWYIFLNIAAGRRYSSLTWPPSSGHRGSMQFWLLEYVAWVVLDQVSKLNQGPTSFETLGTWGKFKNLENLIQSCIGLFYQLKVILGRGNDNKACRDLRGSKDNYSHFEHETDCSLAQSFSLLAI